LENLYGPTEGTIYASGYSLAHWNGKESIPIGKPLPNVSLYIFDRNLHLVPVGITGELHIAGQGVARGYINRPELTSEKFDHDLWDYQDYHDEKNIQKLLWGSSEAPRGGFLEKSPPDRRRQKHYKTGDLTSWLPDGNIEFFGRIDQQVKIRGFRIELEEIETRLLTHEKIEEAVVIVKDSKGLDENDNYLCAFFTAETELSTSQLREYLASKLPEYMIPAYFTQIEKIPLTGSGKADKKSLASMDFKISLENEYVEPQSDKERIVADVWKEILKLDKVGIYDSFFEIGGNSLKSIQVILRLNKMFDMKIPQVAIFSHSTIHSLARLIDQKSLELHNRLTALEMGKRDKMQRLAMRKRIKR
jgi:acyl-coenzyme A synthetase/AMP-(fatty) acid ligase/acyl carrier protein